MGEEPRVGTLVKAQRERLSQCSPDKHERPSCYEPHEKVATCPRSVFLTVAVRKDVSAKKISPGELAEGAVPCCRLLYAISFSLEEAQVSFGHQIRQSGIGLPAPHLVPDCLGSNLNSNTHSCGFFFFFGHEVWHAGS